MYRKYLIAFVFFLVILFSVLLLFTDSFAGIGVTGVCSNCHPMHSDEGGMIKANKQEKGPNPFLLRFTGCIGCHSSTDPNNDYDPITRAPIVYTKAEGGPRFGAFYNGKYQGLAGGNFYWVEYESDNKGHNVFFHNPDDNHIEIAPGGAEHSCSSISQGDCHITLSEICYANDYPGLNNRQGCTKCHMVDDDNPARGFHHDSDPNIIIGEDNFALLFSKPWYRFLKGHNLAAEYGVAGGADPNYQLFATASKHNEYRGRHETNTNLLEPLSLNKKTMTAFCCGCHGRFHTQIDPNKPSVWIRHPSDVPLPNRGEYAGYIGTNKYNPQAPVARYDLGSSWTSPSPDVEVGDMVMCLSCHRAHGSPYDDMLRWDYDTMIAGDRNQEGLSGCFICHTEKGGRI